MSNNQKIYILENLGCANCAAKMERKIQDLPGVESATITFATKQLRINGDDPDKLKHEIQHICSSIEGEVLVTEPHHEHGKAKNSFFSEHKSDVITLIIGAIFFAVGVVFQRIWGYDMWFAGGGRMVLINLAIFITAYLLLGHKVLLTAVRNISRGQIFDENFLMSIATIAAFCIGEFPEGAGVMLFYRIGELFEDIAVERSRSQIMDAVDMRPETVMLATEDSCHHDCCGHDHDHEHHHEHCCCGHDHVHNDARIIPASEAKPGDVLIVRPGDRIPLDGIIVEGESRIDTSPITGEPVPISARPGSEVISGCINVHGVLKIRVIKPLSESMVTKILDSVENAAAGKPKIDKFITKFARVYTPIVVALAILTAIVPSLLTGDWAMWIKTAITFLVISCPCALVISVPLAFFSGIGAASKLGILFKGGLAIEALKNVKAIIMDKTGTITKGVFVVDSISTFNDISQQEVLSIAAACETSSSHPVADSIIKKHEEQLNAFHETTLYVNKAASIEELPGMGIKCLLKSNDTDNTVTALCGNRKLMDKFDVTLPELLEASGTEVLVALDDKLIGRIMISDQLKDDSLQAMDRLKSMGLTPAMLTGDNMQSATAVASASGISKVRAGLLPEDKVTALNELRSELGAVMFVGDGINDAPVLAGADVGAAMGSGADAAIEAADVVFMSSSLESIPQSISIARYTGRIAMQNIIFALAIKLLVIVLGIAGFANIWAAVFADTGVAMICILNSLRVLWRKYL
ncbi:MAG: heavy metal translocating P-type ATPase [Bacillota bacterium]|nr:heavy metal translocating P-type ATPase [Bacillota bacterium]